MLVKGEIRSLTGLRGAAAVYVVVFHYTLGVEMSNTFTTLLAHGYLAVDLFFVLSGFVMALNYGHLFDERISLRAYRIFLGRRVARIYPLYFLGTCLGLGLVALSLIEPLHSRSTLGNALANFSMVQTWGFGQSYDPPAWSISTEWAAYLLFPVLIIPSLSRKPLLRWFIFFVCLATLWFLCYSPLVAPGRVHSNALIDLHTPYLGLPVARCLAEFVLGLLAFRFSTSPANASRGAWLSITMCLLAVFFLAQPKGDLGFIITLPFLIFCLASDDSLPRRILSSRFLEWLGLLSYSIYLIHDLMGGLIAWLHSRAAELGIPHAQTAGALICFALTFPAAWLAYKFVEVPGRKLLRNVFEKGQGAHACVGGENTVRVKAIPRSD